MFEEDALRKDVLVVLPSTAFQIEYLIELTASIEINSDNFEGLSKVYNRLHNKILPTYTAYNIDDLYRIRMTEAKFL